ncbi:MAG: hypothetical protein DRP62_03450 [Planctomycetota bacterium]|nr:MAG: hypothetical protein DRP62_03450 [Planctomycetota bacterium]
MGRKKWYKNYLFLFIFAQKACVFCQFPLVLGAFLPIFSRFFLVYLTQATQTNLSSPIFSSKTNIRLKEISKNPDFPTDRNFFGSQFQFFGWWNFSGLSRKELIKQQQEKLAVL